MNAPDRFDLLGPLPTGTTLLEASAGTGKTYTIAALATRYIAEGVATIDQMLMITFGRSATRELRERVREALTRGRDALRGQTRARDPVVRQLLDLPADQQRAAADRLARAVADFDAGTIATTHQFCSTALSGLGISADTDPGEVFVENISELVDEVVADFYVRKYGGPQAVADPIPYGEALDIARKAVGDPQASLAAGPVTDGSIQATRQSFAEAVRAEVLRRRRSRRWVTFDDLVLRLEAALTDPVTGQQACRHLRAAYRVVLVDEFQDTDPAQWTILREAFHGSRTLILIGDPKQAIYAFRGADIFSYLDAAGHADHHATLPTNWRSDAAVVSGIEAIMGGMRLGDPQIVVRPVDAAHDESRLHGVASQARVRLRVVAKKSGRTPGVPVQRAAVAADVADDIVATLTGPARLATDSASPRPVAPGDIAVLVGTHKQAGLVREALAAANVPAVVTSPTSVFATTAASQWADLLRAMQRPRGSALRAAGLTDFVGYSPADLATDGERLDTELVSRLRDWSQVLERDSVAEMVATIERETGVAARVLSRPDGERDLTDLRHVAGALHTQQRGSHVGPVGLLDWLEEQIRTAQESRRDAATELTRRLETDAEAVQVLTVHVSKGLEFPIVYVPFGWDLYPLREDGPLLCHDAQGRRVLDVRGPDAIDRDALLTARNAEEAGEDLRMLYVALTRASSQLVVHWAPSPQNTKCAPLHRVLSARLVGSSDPEQAYPVRNPPIISSPWLAVEDIVVSPARRWEPAAAQLPRLGTAPFTRHVDTAWRRTSYSGLTARVHEAERHPGGFRDDEPDEVVEEGEGGAPLAGLESPFAAMPAGAAFGTLVHQVLEVAGTPADLADRCREQVAVFPVAGVDADALAQALLPVMRTPLGPLAAGLTLADLPPSDRLPELDFELPMGADGARTLADLADLLRRHLPVDDPLAEYAGRLATPGLAEASLVGYLTGSIDVVLRVQGATPHFLVVDYKTNLLRDPAHPGIEGLVDGYHPDRLAEAMMDAHYPLQALLYNAALHRFLRWRVPDYDPGTHLGGVLYLFLRGMAGPATPAGCGVFAWQPPAALVVALSDLLDGRRP